MDPMKKKKLEIILAVVVILAVIIILIILFWKRPSTEPEVTDETPTELPDGSDITQPDVDYEVPEGPQEQLPQTAVRVFVERFGSFSSESDYINIDDILPMATASLQPRLESVADQARGGNGTYYGISTKIITIEELSNDGSTAAYYITTQRQEAIDTPANTTIRYQDIEVTLVKNGLNWLVNDFAWHD